MRKINNYKPDVINLIRQQQQNRTNNNKGTHYKLTNYNEKY